MNDNQSMLQLLFYTYGFRFYRDGLYNVNLFGVRAMNRTTNSFNDIICLAYYDEAGWKTCSFPATTDPGATSLGEKMGNSKGTALLPVSTLKGSSQYVFKLGKHKNKYIALNQAEPFAVVRDNDQDCSLLSIRQVERLIAKGMVDSGYHGINMHHASGSGVSVNVGNWSLGCQVIQSIFDWNKLISIIKRSTKSFGDNFTYTLFAEEDIQDILGASIDAFHRRLNDNRLIT